MDDTEEEASESLGDGPLTLTIVCTKCNAQFELNKVAVALAFDMNTSFKQYLRFVQSSECENCEKVKEEA